MRAALSSMKHPEEYINMECATHRTRKKLLHEKLLDN
jgi:hypothetical protein